MFAGYWICRKKKHASSCSFGLILNVPLGSILCMSYSKLYYIQLNTKIHPSCLLCCVIENITKCSYLCQKCNSFIIRIMFTQQLIHTSTDTFIFCVYCQKFCQCNTICYFLLLSLVNAQKETAFTQKETAFILGTVRKRTHENDKRTSCILSNIVNTRAGSTYVLITEEDEPKIKFF